MIRVTGASDDLIEIDGDIREEYDWCSHEDEKRYLAFSDGTVLSCKYDDDGIWRFNTVSKGTSEIHKVDGIVDEDTNDVVTLNGDIKWVLFGVSCATV